MRRYEHGLCLRLATDLKEQGLYPCSGGLLFQMAHFFPCNKTNNATHIADLYFKAVFKLHGIPMSMLD